MALPPPPTDLARILAMGPIAPDGAVQRTLGAERLPQGRTPLNSLLSQLLAMLKLDDNGTGPGICLPCDKCGTVRVRWVWLAQAGSDALAVKGFCPRCRGRVEARLEL